MDQLEMNTIFDKLPAEINTIIISYLDYIDYKNIHNLNLKLDYFYLIALRFNKYYTFSIIKYDIKLLYKDFLKYNFPYSLNIINGNVNTLIYLFGNKFVSVSPTVRRNLSKHHNNNELSTIFSMVKDDDF